MAKYLKREPQASGVDDPAEWEVALFYCLGYPKPRDYNPFAWLEADADGFWEKFEAALLREWDGPGKPESWHDWQYNKANAPAWKRKRPDA
ncbi:hypothetical protein [Pseudohaliea sp.]|uniref:hypothetical protein n=1 Tax=Pseudohaliea sp. TaxID=2740289 RepID=UPI0032EC408B